MWDSLMPGKRAAKACFNGLLFPDCDASCSTAGPVSSIVTLVGCPCMRRRITCLSGWKHNYNTQPVLMILRHQVLTMLHLSCVGCGQRSATKTDSFIWLAQYVTVRSTEMCHHRPEREQ